MVIRPVDFRHFAEIRTLVETPSAKGNRECLQPAPALFRRVMQNRRRIHSARSPHSQWHVGNQVFPHRLSQQPVQLFLRRLQRIPARSLARQLPPSLYPALARAPFEQVPRRHLSNSFDQRPIARHVVDRKKPVQRPLIQPPRNVAVLQNRLEFAPKVQIVAAAVVIQRLDPHPVARQHQPLPGLRPQRHPEHSSHPLEACRVPLHKCPQHRLGVTLRSEPVPQPLQLTPDLPVVVYFAVEHNHSAAVIAYDWLIATGQVDDLQPHRAQRDFAALVYPLLVRPPVVYGLDDAPGHLPVPHPAQPRKSRNPAHSL